MNKFIVDTTDTYYLDNIYNDINILCDNYSQILKKEVIGRSVEGREIIALRLSGEKNGEIPRFARNDNKREGIKPSPTTWNDKKQEGTRSSPTVQNDNIREEILRYALDDKKPSILLTGGIHAREDFSVMLCMKMLDYYCYNYNKEKNFEGFDVKKIIDTVAMHFIPVANPDGLNIVHHGIEASSNYYKLKDVKVWGEDHTYWKANSNGVDLNKNFDDGNWEIRTCVPGTDVPCSDRFKGYAANSEPETQAIINYCNKNNFTLMVTYHCSGNCTFWADSGTHNIFGGLDEKIMDELNKKYIYRKTKVSQDPSIYGCGFENWFRAVKRRPAFCIELSPFVEGGKQHPDSMFEELVWQHAKTTGLFFAEKAKEVYDEIYGDVKKYAAMTANEGDSSLRSE